MGIRGSRDRVQNEAKRIGWALGDTAGPAILPWVPANEEKKVGGRS